ncbi:MAG: FG-GAP repeat domain-containing protein [Elainella sp.]
MALRFTPRQIIQRFAINATQRFTPVALAAADFNRDGALDIVTNGFYLFLGRGNGSFSPVALPTDLQQLSFNQPAVADLNRDGNPDLISLGSEIQTWLGDGRGGFTAAQRFAVGPVSQSVISDLNGDRNPDVVVIKAGRAQSATQSVTILLGNGSGFTAPQTVTTQGRPWAAAAGDFNGDGKRDLVLLNRVSHSEATGRNRSTRQLTLLLGRGNGTFRTADSTPIKANQFSQLVAGDFNRDGTADLAVGSNQTVTVLLGSQQGLNPHRQVSTGFTLVENLTTGNFTGDGNLDLAITESDVGYTGFRVMQGDGQGDFDSPSRAFGTSVDYDHSEEANAYSAIKGDFNGDGNLDLATADGASYTSGTVTVFLNARSGRAGARLGQGRTAVDLVTGLPSASAELGVGHHPASQTTSVIGPRLDIRPRPVSLEVSELAQRFSTGWGRRSSLPLDGWLAASPPGLPTSSDRTDFGPSVWEQGSGRPR